MGNPRLTRLEVVGIWVLAGFFVLWGLSRQYRYYEEHFSVENARIVFE